MTVRTFINPRQAEVIAGGVTFKSLAKQQADVTDTNLGLIVAAGIVVLPNHLSGVQQGVVHEALKDSDFPTSNKLQQ